MQPNSTKNLIEVKDLSFSYDNQEEILKGINLSLQKGDYLGIIGPNGGGKTTLIRLILGLLKPSKGSIKLFGQDITNFKDKSKIGYVPQKLVNLDTNFPATVEEVVAMGLYPKKPPFTLLDKSDRGKINIALERVDLVDLRNKLIGELSGGQQQRTFIARSLVSDPEIIFLDEPTVGVDIKAQENFYTLLEKLNREFDLTLVLVTHDIDVVVNESTQLACINQTLIYHGSPKEFIKGDYLEKLYGKNVKFIVHDH